MGLILSLSGETIIDISMDTSVVMETTGKDTRIEDLKPSPNAPSVAHNAALAQASSSPQESPEPTREVRN